jgi:hypothetical protein
VEWDSLKAVFKCLTNLQESTREKPSEIKKRLKKRRREMTKLISRNSRRK